MPKIISGKYRNRLVSTTRKLEYRPSTGRLKEAVFSILSSGDFINHPILSNAKVLDLFAGSGAFAFEALSRGAASATLIDINLESLMIAKNFAKAQNIIFLNLNSTNLPKSAHRYNLIFIDPPYNQELIPKAIASLIQGNWLEDNAILVLEMSKVEEFHPLEIFTVIIDRIYGNSRLLIMRF